MPGRALRPEIISLQNLPQVETQQSLLELYLGNVSLPFAVLHGKHHLAVGNFIQIRKNDQSVISEIGPMPFQQVP
eukprot:Skav218951  [mRNA]  locus=scaffold531:92477:103353:- [translate_table: standard]